ncbi:MAG: hypothetical protein B7Y99_02055 [Caulobacterales bacterium 32-69-10]|nr:MAG: hypothetical protein B7Y99_02055 [Caulobacterales bacterium 32-69-10]
MTDVKTDHGGDLFRLVYASRAALPVLARFEATVVEILAVSQANNARHGLTGLLLAHQGWFVQALEGPRRNVSQVFGVIGRDARHGQVEVMIGGPAGSRLFGQWSMCGRAVTPKSAPILAALDLNGEFDPFRMQGDKILALLAAISKAPDVAVLKKAG